MPLLQTTHDIIGFGCYLCCQLMSLSFCRNLLRQCFSSVSLLRGRWCALAAHSVKIKCTLGLYSHFRKFLAFYLIPNNVSSMFSSNQKGKLFSGTIYCYPKIFPFIGNYMLFSFHMESQEFFPLYPSVLCIFVCCLIV